MPGFFCSFFCLTADALDRGAGNELPLGFVVSLCEAPRRRVRVDLQRLLLHVRILPLHPLHLLRGGTSKVNF